MKITVIYNKASGVCYHRLLQPAKYLAQQYPDLQIIYVDEMECMKDMSIYNCDIVWYSTLFLYDMAILAQLKDQYGFKLVMDLDDYPEPYAGQIHYDAWIKFGFKAIIFKGLKLADLVIVTNDQLKQVYELFTKQVIIVPNALAFDQEQFKPQRVPSDDVRFIYMVGNNHEHDFYTLKPLITDISKDKLFQQKGQLILCGYNKPFPEENVYDRIEIVANLSNKYVRQELLSFDSYMQHYNTGDVAIAPLINNVYNACRSNLKFLEAAAMRMPLICNNALPYTTDKDASGIIFCESIEGWYAAFDFFLKNHNKIEEYGEANYNYAKKHYNLVDINKLRYKAFKELAANNVNKYIPIINTTVGNSLGRLLT